MLNTIRLLKNIVICLSDIPGLIRAAYYPFTAQIVCCLHRRSVSIRHLLETSCKVVGKINRIAESVRIRQDITRPVIGQAPCKMLGALCLIVIGRLGGNDQLRLV
ncbi:hypothetical protein D3C75_646500 [compost metagenome]